MDIYPGLIVKAIAGRDKDKYFVVLSVKDDSFCYIADGKRRKVDMPKLKKIKHLEVTELKSDLIREKLECMAASLAAERCTEEQLAELKETLEFQEFYLSKQDAEHIKLMDNKFHRTLYRLTGSMTFYDTLVPLHKKIQKYRRASVESKSRANASVLEHRKIFEAIAEKNSELAAKYAKEHVENAYNHIMGRD